MHPVPFSLTYQTRTSFIDVESTLLASPSPHPPIGKSHYISQRLLAVLLVFPSRAQNSLFSHFQAPTATSRSPRPMRVYDKHLQPKASAFLGCCAIARHEVDTFRLTQHHLSPRWSTLVHACNRLTRSGTFLFAISWPHPPHALFFVILSLLWTRTALYFRPSDGGKQRLVYLCTSDGADQ
ncbi:hypothetical protein OF83DRAFT_383955 [Amylostereum chailletii]|nr:hypothetical protein OF83DRAFT_383955 [Amylostereum chailletii]